MSARARQARAWPSIGRKTRPRRATTPARHTPTGDATACAKALHEIAPLLGLARAAAESALDEDSQVRTQLERMRAVTGALRQLVSASSVPERRDFDLSELLAGLRLSPRCRVLMASLAPGAIRLL